MTPEEAEPFLAALAAVAEIFERELSDAAQTLYFDALKDLPLVGCLYALEEAARSNTFMPRPAELRRLANGSTGDLEQATEAAWLTFKAVARAVGAYGSPTFDDPALADTIVAIFDTWERACWIDLSPEMWASKRKEFGRVYALFHERPGSVGPKTLDGFCARTNRERYGLPDPLHAELPERGTVKLLPGAIMPIARDIVDERVVVLDTWRRNVNRALAAHCDRAELAGTPA